MGQAPSPCPVCGADGDFVVAGDRDAYGVTDYRAVYYRCKGCGVWFQSPMPDAETVARFYPSGYWREDDVGGLLSRLQRAYVSWLLRADLMRWFARMNLPAGASVVDVGCSRGDWAAMIRARGFHVEGVEADARAAAHARDRYGLTVSQETAEAWRPPAKAYDAVLAFHLLEHVRDPVAFLTRCVGALKPGGKLMLRVPNPGSLQQKLLGGRWKGLEPPRHLTMWPPQTLANVLHRCGFDIETYSDWSLRDGPPCLSSSIFPWGEPTRQAILGQRRPLATLAYLGLTWAVTPLEFAAVLANRGAMATVIAKLRE